MKRFPLTLNLIIPWDACNLFFVIIKNRRLIYSKWKLYPILIIVNASYLEEYLKVWDEFMTSSC